VFPEAPLALQKPDLPPSTTNFEHPIDRLLAYFDEQALRWPTLVDDRIFIRRVYLDIIGLLPETDAVDTFLQDRTNNKREKLIDKLSGKTRP